MRSLLFISCLLATIALPGQSHDAESFYMGFLPCKDCRAVELVLGLNSRDKSFLLQEAAWGTAYEVRQSAGNYQYSNNRYILTSGRKITGRNTLYFMMGDIEVMRFTRQ